MMAIRSRWLWLSAASMVFSALSADAVTFRNIGPGGGGTPGCIATDPNNPKVVYVGLDCGGMHVTTDGGEHWRNANVGIAGDGGQIDWNNHYGVIVLNSGRAVATSDTGQIYISDNQGQSWAEVFSTPGGLGALLQHPTDANTVYAVTGRSLFNAFPLISLPNKMPSSKWSGSIFVSDKAGAKGSWRKVNTDAKANIPGDAYIHNMAIDHVDAKVMYVATSYGVYRSIDGGASWTNVQKGLGPISAKWLVTVPGKPNTVYATLGGVDKKAFPQVTSCVYRSNDRGETWTACPKGLPAEKNYGTMTVDPANANVIYVGSSDWNGGLYRTTDGGDTWGTVFDNESFAKLSEQEKRDNLVWFPDGLHMAVGEGIGIPRGDANKDGLSDTIYFISDNTGHVWKSTNAGKKWQQVISHDKYINGRRFTSGRGEIEFFCTRRIFVDPTNAKHLWIVNFDWGILESVDGGESFASCFGPWVDGVLVGASMDLAIDPDDPKLVFCAAGSPSAIFTNMNGKGWWILAGGTKPAGGLEAGVDRLAISKYTANGTTHKYLYATMPGKGIYRAAMKGFAWEKVSTGLKDDAVKTLGMIVAVPNSKTLFINTHDGIYRSDDGTTWKQVTGPGTKNEALKGFIMGIVVDPRDTKKLYAAMMGPFQRVAEEGVYASSDNGETWTRIAHVPMPYELALDTKAVTPTLYVATGIEGVFKVTKKPNSDEWTSAVFGNRDNGLDTTRCWTVTVDPHNSRRIYVGTHGTGIFVGQEK